MALMVMGSIVVVIPLILILSSCGAITWAVLRMQSTRDLQKIFGICGAHLWFFSFQLHAYISSHHEESLKIKASSLLLLYCCHTQSQASHLHPQKQRFSNTFPAVPSCLAANISGKLKSPMANVTTSEFLLMGFSATPELELVHASLFLVLSMVAVTGNILIITATSMDHSLHFPMFFFLKGLSFLDLCYVSVTVPRSIYNSFLHSGDIPLRECKVQCFAFAVSGSAKLSMLTAMSYDHYVASALHCATKSSWMSAHASMESWVCGAAGPFLEPCTQL
ncbi:Olfactory receptor 14J1, partial [Galemys pyrenaicus]